MPRDGLATFLAVVRGGENPPRWIWLVCRDRRFACQRPWPTEESLKIPVCAACQSLSACREGLSKRQKACRDRLSKRQACQAVVPKNGRILPFLRLITFRTSTPSQLKKRACRGWGKPSWRGPFPRAPDVWGAPGGSAFRGQGVAPGRSLRQRLPQQSGTRG